MGQTRAKVLRTAFDTYKLQNLRGAGRSGEVFEALDSEGVLRAVKILHAVKASPVGLKRARDEFNFCFRSNHKNIIAVLDCGLTGSKPAAFYVMPLYARSLRDCMKQGIPAENVLRIYGNILDGMEAAHLQGIWHRDLKPENLLTNDDGRDLAIADFGVAHALEEQRRLTHARHCNQRNKTAPRSNTIKQGGQRFPVRLAGKQKPRVRRSPKRLFAQFVVVQYHRGNLSYLLGQTHHDWNAKRFDHLSRVMERSVEIVDNICCSDTEEET